MVADDTAVMGLISNNNETSYLEEIKYLETWCQDNNLLWDISKTKELIVDFSTKQERNYQPLIINGTPLERVDSFQYLGVHITQDLPWTCHVNTLVKKARQHLYHLRHLKNFKVPSKVLKTFYSCTIESILMGSITAWFGNSTQQDRQALQRVVGSAEPPICAELPDLETIYSKRCWTKARKIMKDLGHPNSSLLGVTSSQTTEPFYPYGHGDIAIAQIDDGSSSVITLQQPFIYFGHTYNQMFVNTNGHLTFDNGWYSYTPYQFPVTGGRDLIAPFWTDLDNRGNGVVSYNQFTSGSVLTQATQNINQYFPQLTFSATWVFVATWDRVAYYPLSGTETSFQVVLISNGNYSFILMNYGVIAPTRRRVQAGYDTADSSYYFSIPGSFQYNYTSFTYSSNVNVQGRWAFRVDHASRGCQFDGNFVQLGAIFWTDNSCQQKCTCTRSGLQCISEPCTFAQACRPAAFRYSCQNVQRRTCIISGDPHYYTFDNQIFHFQGTCTYILSEACGNGLPYYRIEGKNEHRGSTHVSWTRLVRVFVYDEVLELVKDHPYEAKVKLPCPEHSHYEFQGTSCPATCSNPSSPLNCTLPNQESCICDAGYVLSGGTCVPRRNCGCTFNGLYYVEGQSVVLDNDCGRLCTCSNMVMTCQHHQCGPQEVCTINNGVRGCRPTSYATCWVDRLGSYHTFDELDFRYQGACELILTRVNESSTLPNFTVTLQRVPMGALGFSKMLKFEAGGSQISLEMWEGGNIKISSAQPTATMRNVALPALQPVPSLSFPFPCTQLCQEGCQCDNGLVLSGDQCVPPTSCGCFHEGRYRQSGEQFWSSQQCQFHCVCDGTSGFVNCSSSSCQEHEICHVIDGEYGCHSRPSATCSASGDPHYTSFDGHRFDFQGTCHYTLATVCNDTLGLPYFQVTARNEAWNGLSVSITVEVYVNVSGHLVHVSRNMYGTAEIDSETRNLPALLDSGRVSVYSNGRNTFITTDFGLSVSYDGSWEVIITVPGNYSGATCGLCGNFNGDSNDDFRLQSGMLTSSATEFGADWKVGNDTTCNDGCGDSCPLCQDPSRAQSLCGIIMDNQGPLSFCHAYVDPLAYFNDCVFDLCLSEHRNEVLCRSIEAYVSACQSANVRIYPWRENTTCSINCAANSHYELCGSDCGHTCTSSTNVTCERTCREGCFCDEGYVRSGGNCVPAEQCGCSYNGFYFQIGEKFWTEHCLQHCECLASNDLRCISAPCSPTEECVIRNSRLGCYSQMSTCIVSGDPHYYTFDGAVAHFQGTCSYEISQTCGNVSDNGLQFSVVATNMHRGSTVVSFVSVVDVWLTRQEEQTRITIGQNRKVKVNGNAVNSSTYQISNLAEIYHEQNFIVVNASHELVVYFDGQFTLLVRLGPSFHGSVCGMCGNNNGDPADDKTLPSGELAPNDASFGNSWTSTNSSPGCGASDQPVDDNDCPFREEYSALCSIITNTSGPFQHCHFRISPQPYYTSCVYDLCAYPQTWGQDLLCSAVEAYDAACTMLELLIPNWRSDLSCSRVDPCEDLQCTENEWCGEKDGNYGCFCNENYPRQNPDSYDSTEICESSSGTMSLSRCQLFEAGFLASNLHLHDPSCNGTVHDGRLVFHFDNDEHICGTNLTANGTHFIYENIIQGEVGSTASSIHRKKRLELRFSCIYKLSQTFTMDRELNPIQSIVHKTLPGEEGMYQIRMIPYEDAGFSHPYNGSVEIEVGQQIYIGIFVQGVDSRQIATVIDSCWATPVNQANYTVHWDLITRKCPNSNDATVKILENGVSTTGRFSFKMFSFYEDESRVFLHCRIHLCLLRTHNCAARCYPGYHHRSGRSLGTHDSASISMGPFIWTAKSRDV
ncbi:hypothetical protein QTP70_032905 [Hemibagrus guttatus]|uniref:Alpha-tectorin n=1 Tax=Hemibagrus guttatus TaxID=175788 RepID=A0AAE0PVT2_9TELE|nr:hypothetical protein QTP70_032905 [Hemibagrus guttatus]